MLFWSIQLIPDVTVLIKGEHSSVERPLLVSSYLTYLNPLALFTVLILLEIAQLEIYYLPVVIQMSD